MNRLASRIAKLEQRAKAANPVARASVVEFGAATGKPTAPLPTARRVMVATNFGTDADWQAACRRQQTALLAH